MKRGKNIDLRIEGDKKMKRRENIESFKRTGVFATPDEVSTIKDMFNAPLIAPGGVYPPSPWEEIDRLSVKHGLPETTTQRGMDLRNGEFLEYTHGK